ncbi:conserved hypothetical protein [Vibrio nigripulchritudo MADA3029]|uniref:Uncharacterized protein n=1 Tax=Vibrio nigripulchritudo TaxID=28173 RepID=U4KH73_9VIBR|nr:MULTISPECIES: DUF6678 family protein [Vibrio]UTZ24295.1 hypothetical protein HB760_21425 [Vibrio campbellii]CCN46535.1 conserved hypothetical protein [Vibrio nigripulchritudo MADA3020]CCN56506.1 conserved hypothetical protein [Vibrio nigripulchritudo MADA3021]CCN61501.1 conserved hypothetical protein [Vibrio nigripulchritudo MADA3029]CCO59274.1 conserved hypothetical protein [Vibrio nigripulchritudo]
MSEKYRKIINDRQLVSAMNKTKWRELCVGFEALQSLNISVRYKLISSDEIYGFSTVWWDEVFEESPFIEWLDFNPIVYEHQGRLVAAKETDRRNEILAVFEKYGIRYSLHETHFRVWGYLSQDTNPEFV